jgi:serine/threonine protein kinase
MKATIENDGPRAQPGSFIHQETSLRPEGALDTARDQETACRSDVPEPYLSAELPDSGLPGHQLERTRTSYGPPQLSKGHPARPGTQVSIDGFEMLKLLKKGGEGEVWEVRDVHTDRSLAIKIFNRSDYVYDDKSAFHQQRALNEHVANNLSSVLGINGWGELADGRPYIVMNRMDHNRGCKEVILECFESPGPAQPAKLRVPIEQFIQVFEEGVRTMAHLATPLHGLHQIGIVHRDIKPDNIMFGEATGVISVNKDPRNDFDGKPFRKEDAFQPKQDDVIKHFDYRRAKLLDLGISERWTDTVVNKEQQREDFKKFQASCPMVSRAPTDRVTGTPAFTPKECYTGEQGPWSDQYSFALAFYEFFTGCNPRALDNNETGFSRIPPLEEALPKEFLEKMKDPDFEVCGMPATSLVYMLSATIEQATMVEYTERHKDMEQMAALLNECVLQDEVVWSTYPQPVRDSLRRLKTQQREAQKELRQQAKNAYEEQQSAEGQQSEILGEIRNRDAQTAETPKVAV